MAYLVGYYGPRRCSCVCCYDHAAVKDASDDRSTCTCSLGKRYSLSVERGIATVIGKVEARHDREGNMPRQRGLRRWL